MGLSDALRTKYEVHPSVILWLSILGYLRPKIVLPFALSVLLHELGHYLCLRAMGLRPRRVTFTLVGAGMETPELSYRQEFLCALSGPAVSLLLGLLLPIWPMLGGYSLCLGLINLLPLGTLDGGRMLRCILLLHLPEDRAKRLFRGLNLLFAALLLVPGIYCYVHLDLGVLPLIILAVLLYKALAAGVL